MPNSITVIIKKIKDSDLAKLRVPDRDGELFDINCIYKESESPRFFLVFPPGTIPDHLKEKLECTVSIHSEEDSIVLNAVIEAFIGDRTIELVGRNMIDPVSLREYFRVFFKTTITASYEPTNTESTAKPWTAKGESVDLSGTGVLAIFPHELSNRNNIFLDFDLPDQQESIHCIAHVVRTRRIRKSRFQVALHFDHITRKKRDAVITACLQEQRRQLRERMESG